MKKKSFNEIVLISLCFSVLVQFSACEMFTSSLGKGFQRNQRDILEKASVSDLLTFSQGANASNPDTMKAVLNLLSQKNSEELKKLSAADKETVLNLTMDATLSMEKVSEMASQIGDLASDPSPDKAEKIVKKFLDGINTFDTKASTELLSDPETMKNAKPAALAKAAAALIAQVAAKKGYDKIKDNIRNNAPFNFETDTAENLVNKMLGASASQEDKAALKAAVNAAKLLQKKEAQDSKGNTVTRPDIDPKDAKLLGLMPLGDILKSFN